MLVGGLAALLALLVVAGFVQDHVQRRRRRSQEEEWVRSLAHATPDELAEKLRAAVGVLWVTPPPSVAERLRQARGWTPDDLGAAVAEIDAAFRSEPRPGDTVLWFDASMPTIALEVDRRVAASAAAPQAI